MNPVPMPLGLKGATGAAAGLLNAAILSLNALLEGLLLTGGGAAGFDCVVAGLAAGGEVAAAASGCLGAAAGAGAGSCSAAA